MATTASVSLHFNYHPLTLSTGIVCNDAVPDEQIFDGATNSHAPDYSLTPLVLTPVISVSDTDGVFNSSNAASHLSNVRWQAIEDGVQTQISTGTSYEVSTATATNGRLKVKRNISPASPVTFVFTATMTDPRGTGEIHQIRLQRIVRCKAVSSALTLRIDAGNPAYDPTRDQDSRTLTAKLWVGGSPAADANWLARWEFYRETGDTWSEAGSDDFDYFATVSGKTLTIRQSMMREGVKLRCRAVYDAGGNPSMSSLGSNSPACYASITRRIPALYARIERCPGRLLGGQTLISPKVRVRTHGQKGEVSLSAGRLFARWKMATSSAMGLGTKKVVAEGDNPTIKLSNLGSYNDGVLECEIIDGGPLKPWADESGSVLVDESGNWLLI